MKENRTVACPIDDERVRMQNVADWLRNIGLEPLAEQWVGMGITGKSLKGLIHLRGQRALKETLQRDLGLSDTRTMLTLTGNLMTLFHVI